MGLFFRPFVLSICLFLLCLSPTVRFIEAFRQPTAAKNKQPSAVPKHAPPTSRSTRTNEAQKKEFPGKRRSRPPHNRHRVVMNGRQKRALSLTAILALICGIALVFKDRNSIDSIKNGNKNRMPYKLGHDVLTPNQVQTVCTWESKIIASNDIRSDTFRETLKIFRFATYISKVGGNVTIPLQDIFPSYEKFDGYSKDTQVPVGPSPGKASQVVCLALDTFEAARLFAVPGEKVMVLNMGDAFKAGGEIMSAYKTQEEELCRRSNLFYSIRSAEDAGLYPLQRDDWFAAIYSTNVTVIKDIDFSLLESPYKVDILSLAFLYLLHNRTIVYENNPKGPKQYQISPKSIKEQTLRRVRTIFKIASEKKADTLILGPIGCGAFSNESRLVSKLFMQVLRDEFSGFFKNIIFTTVAHKGNLTVFSTARDIYFPNPFSRQEASNAFSKSLALRILSIKTAPVQALMGKLRADVAEFNSEELLSFSRLVDDSIFDMHLQSCDYVQCFNRLQEISML